ncbi:MAG: ABC transporter permease, partial [Pseudomonadales bacterium]
MSVFIIKRLLSLIPTLLLASMLIFLFVHLIPGDPAAVLLGDLATPEEVAALTKEMGLDEPVYLQYYYWLTHVLQGDLGTSIFFQVPVLSVIGDGAETSILLALMTMIWIITIGLPLGILAASRHGTIVD